MVKHKLNSDLFDPRHEDHYFRKYPVLRHGVAKYNKPLRSLKKVPRFSVPLPPTPPPAPGLSKQAKALLQLADSAKSADEKLAILQSFQQTNPVEYGKAKFLEHPNSPLHRYTKAYGGRSASTNWTYKTRHAFKDTKTVFLIPPRIYDPTPPLPDLGPSKPQPEHHETSFKDNPLSFAWNPETEQYEFIRDLVYNKYGYSGLRKGSKIVSSEGSQYSWDGSHFIYEGQQLFADEF